jgi:hypothetical protein
MTTLPLNVKLTAKHSSFAFVGSHITGDIAQDEELTHTYISLTWRECFSEIDKKLNG